MKKYCWVFLIALFLANIYQIYLNRNLVNQAELESHMGIPKSDSIPKQYERPFFFEEFFLQNKSFPDKFILTDLKGQLIDSKRIIDKEGLILYFNDLDCTSCNVNKIQYFLGVCEQIDFIDFTIVSNLERHKEFVKIMTELGVNRPEVYNSNINMKDLYADTILLFYLIDGKIMYPLVVSTENYSILPAYLSFIKSMDKY